MGDASRESLVWSRHGVPSRARGALAGVSRRPSGGQQVGATWGIPLALAMFLAWGILEALVTHGGFFSEGKAGITCSAGRYDRTKATLAGQGITSSRQSSRSFRGIAGACGDSRGLAAAW